jgi:hypothetical protein
LIPALIPTLIRPALIPAASYLRSRSNFCTRK